MSEPTKNYFEILGLSPEANEVEIKKAFKELAFQYHPDRNPRNAWAEERFKEVVEAYSYLTGNLEAYRALTIKKVETQVHFNWDQDIFQELFDLDLNPISKASGESLEIPLPLTLEEAFAGVDKKIKFERAEICRTCQGRGVEAGAKVFTCTYCFGEGSLSSQKPGVGRVECPKCNGRGFISSRGCTQCRARGRIFKKVEVKAKIPPKVSEGSLIRIAGEGNPLNAQLRGDLVLRVKLAKHPVFTFDGKDIICEVKVELSDATLGTAIRVPTLRGEQAFQIPAGAQSGQVFRLKAMGLGGDQFIRIHVKTPLALSEKDRSFFRQMKERESGEHSGFIQKLKKWFW